MSRPTDYDLLTTEQKQRLAAVACVREVLPELDVFDMVRLADFVLNGSVDDDLSGPTLADEVRKLSHPLEVGGQ
jgi:hypothetical protein